MADAERDVVVRLKYETDQASLNKAKSGAEQLEKRFQSMRETAEKVRQIGTTMTLAGAAITGPLLLAAKAFVDQAGQSSAVAQRWTQSMDSLKQSMTRVGGVVAQQILPYLERAAQLAEKAAAWAEKHPDAVKAILGVGTTLMVGGSIINMLGTMMTTIGSLGVILTKMGVLGGAAVGTGGAAAGMGTAATVASVVGIITTAVATTSIVDLIMQKARESSSTAGKVGWGVAAATVGNALIPGAGPMLAVADAIKAWLIDKFGGGGAQTDKGASTQQQSASLETVNQAVKTYIAYKRQEAEALSQYHEQVATATRNFFQKQAQALADFNAQQAQASASFYRRQSQAASDFARQQAQETSAYNQQRQRAMRDFAAQMRQAEQQYYQQRKQAAKNYSKEVQRAEADHQKAMRRLMEDHNDRVDDLVANQDAYGLLQEQRSYQKDQSRAEEDYRIEAARRSQDFAQQLAEMDEQYRQQRAQAIASFQQRMQDEAADFKQRQAQAKRDFQERQARERQEFQQQQAQARSNFIAQQARERQQFQQQLQDMSNAFQKERTARQNAFNQQLIDLAAALNKERDLKKQISDAELKYLEEVLKKAQAAATTTVPQRAMGGYVSGGLYQMHPNEFVLSAATTRAVERVAQRRLDQDAIIQMLGGGGRQVTINDHRRFDSRLGAQDRLSIRRDTREMMLEALQ